MASQKRRPSLRGKAAAPGAKGCRKIGGRSVRVEVDDDPEASFGSMEFSDVEEMARREAEEATSVTESQRHEDPLEGEGDNDLLGGDDEGVGDGDATGV